MNTTALAGASRTFGKDIDLSRLRRTVQWRRDIASHQRDLALSLLPTRKRVQSCPICQGDRTGSFAVIFDFSYRECLCCGHIFCSTPPTEDALRSLYKTQPQTTPSAQRSVYLDPQLFATRVEMIGMPKAQYISSLLPRGEWVDVGCGSGEILFAAKSMGWAVRGVESDAAEADFARQRGLDVMEMFIDKDNADQIAGNADVVSLVNVLEHVADPSALLLALAGPLKAGAAMVLEVPRHPSLSSLCSVCFPELAARHIYPPDHLHIFTERSMECLLETAGLSVVSAWFFGQDFHEALLCLSSHSRQPTGPWVAAIHESSNSVQRTLDTRGLSDTMLVVAKK